VSYIYQISIAKLSQNVNKRKNTMFAPTIVRHLGAFNVLLNIRRNKTQHIISSMLVHSFRTGCNANMDLVI